MLHQARLLPLLEVAGGRLCSLNGGAHDYVSNRLGAELGIMGSA